MAVSKQHTEQLAKSIQEAVAFFGQSKFQLVGVTFEVLKPTVGTTYNPSRLPTSINDVEITVNTVEKVYGGEDGEGV